MSETDGSGLTDTVRADTEDDDSTAGNVVHVEGADHLDELTASDDVVLADFYADWCGPCKTLEPILEDLAAETDITVAKVDVDEHQSLAASHRVQGVPTMVLFADGDLVERLVGVRDRDTLERLVTQHAPN
jgi:thioredoxin 1